MSESKILALLIAYFYIGFTVAYLRWAFTSDSINKSIAMVFFYPIVLIKSLIKGFIEIVKDK